MTAMSAILLTPQVNAFLKTPLPTAAHFFNLVPVFSRRQNNKL
jgi:hypothetical protein